MVANTMMAALLLLLPVALAGVNDTVDQLRNGFTIVPLSDQVESRLAPLQNPFSLSLPAVFFKLDNKILEQSIIHHYHPQIDWGTQN